MINMFGSQSVGQDPVWVYEGHLRWRRNKEIIIYTRILMDKKCSV